jgi:hypothetical protein
MSATITWNEFKQLIDSKIKEYLNDQECPAYNDKNPPDIRVKFMETILFPSKEDIQIDIYEHSPGLIYITIL